MPYSLTDIATTLKGELTGDGDLTIHSLSAIDNIIKDSIVVCFDDKSVASASQSHASALVVSKQPEQIDKPTVLVSSIDTALCSLLHLFKPTVKKSHGIHPSAVIGENVTLAENVSIAANAVIGDQVCLGDNVRIGAGSVISDKVSIGANSVIHPNVTIYDQVNIGQSVVIHSNTVVGSDGFGYQQVNGRHEKMPHIGGVRIGDNVEIGANSVIDRGTINDTVIGEGTKIDNLVQVAHNVKLGAHNILCAFTGIAGSSTSGEYVIFAADAGVSDHVTIGNHVTIGPRAGIAAKKKLADNTTWFGSPARLAHQAMEQIITANRLPKMKKTLDSLVTRVKTLEEDNS